MVNALILAGDKGEDGKPKALLEIKGRFMIEYVIDALRDSGVVEKIYIVGDEILKDKIGHIVDGFIKSTGEMLDNIKYSVKVIGDFKRPLLVCTSDIPLIKGDAVRDFVLECVRDNLDLGYPIIDKCLNDEKYPDVKRTYVKMKEGTFTGGNIVFLNPNVVERATKKAEELIAFRKKPLKMGRVLGFSFLLRLAFGILTITAVEKKICDMFEVKGRAILTKYPEIGNDVDKKEDIDFVNRYIS